jgi:hypothetical protein
MIFNQRGNGRGGLILGIFVLFIAIYVAAKIIPVMVKVYAFEDSVKEECKFLHGRSLEQLEEDLVEAANTQELPVDEENIELRKFRSDDHEELRVDIKYTVPITTPVFVYNWNQEINYQAPTFD